MWSEEYSCWKYLALVFTGPIRHRKLNSIFVDFVQCVLSCTKLIHGQRQAYRVHQHTQGLSKTFFRYGEHSINLSSVIWWIYDCYTQESTLRNPSLLPVGVPYKNTHSYLKFRTNNKGEGKKVKVTLEQATQAKKYSCTLYVTSALDGLGGQRHAPAALPPGKARYPLYRRLGGPQGRSGQVRKISSSPGFDPRTVQTVASRYTDWAIPVH